MSSLCDLLLFYVIEITVPFSSQEHLDDMRSYLNKVSSEMNNKIIINPVNASNFTQEEMKEKPVPQIPVDESSSKVHPSEKENKWQSAIENYMNGSDDETMSKDDMYKRLSRTLPIGF